MAKLNLTKDFGKSLTGVVTAGAANALVDTYVAPMLPDLAKTTFDYIKLGVAIVVPAMTKEPMVKSAAEGLGTIAVNDIIKSFLASDDDTPTDNPTTSGMASRKMVGRTPLYPRMKKIGTASQKMVGKTQPKVVH